MTSHLDIKALAEKSFASHKMRRGPGYSWRFAKPGTGAYSFRVTWAPGMIVVSGDIGDATYNVWPSFGEFWSAVELVNGAGWDYLTCKSTAKKVFDLEATIENIVKGGYETARHFGTFPTSFERVVSHYGFDPKVAVDRKSAVRELRDDASLSAEQIYDITGDFEVPYYSYSSETRWCYEALKLWARTVLAREPRWHHAWRRFQGEWRNAKSVVKLARRRHVAFRPVFYKQQRGMDRLWVLRFFEDHKGHRRARMAEAYPIRIFGCDCSKIGFWRLDGSSWPIRKGESRFTAVAR